MLGNNFSGVTQWDAWMPVYKYATQEHGLADMPASTHSINVMPDVENLFCAKIH